jgi:hypothetical protein
MGYSYCEQELRIIINTAAYYDPVVRLLRQTRSSIKYIWSLMFHNIAWHTARLDDGDSEYLGEYLPKNRLAKFL